MQLIVRGEIKLQRGDGNVAGLNCVEIGVVATTGEITRRTYPVEDFVARVFNLLQGTCGMARAEDGGADAFDVLIGQVGDVDIEE